MSGMLLDTHVVLWLLDDSPRLGEGTRSRIHAATRVHISAASTWEIAVKSALGKLTVPEDFAEVIASSGLRGLPITLAHGLAAAQTLLPHRDPFDAMLVAQARSERLTLVTADAKILGAVDGAADARR